MKIKFNPPIMSKPEHTGMTPGWFYEVIHQGWEGYHVFDNSGVRRVISRMDATLECDAPPPVTGSLSTAKATALAPNKVVGRKDDSGKVHMELLGPLSRAVEGVAKVLTWAVCYKEPVPYIPGSWQAVDPFFDRYIGALQRHLNNIQRKGPQALDPETQLLDLYHLATNALILAELVSRDIEAKKETVTC